MMSPKQAESCRSLEADEATRWLWVRLWMRPNLCLQREGWNLNQSTASLRGTGGGQTWESHERLIHIFRHLGTSRNFPPGFG